MRELLPAICPETFATLFPMAVFLSQLKKEPDWTLPDGTKVGQHVMFELSNLEWFLLCYLFDFQIGQ